MLNVIDFRRAHIRPPPADKRPLFPVGGLSGANGGLRLLLPLALVRHVSLVAMHRRPMLASCAQSARKSNNFNLATRNNAKTNSWVGSQIAQHRLDHAATGSAGLGRMVGLVIMWSVHQLDPPSVATQPAFHP